MSAAVNRPTDVAVRDKDVNQKLQLYGIFSGMSQSSVAEQSAHCYHNNTSILAYDVDD